MRRPAVGAVVEIAVVADSGSAFSDAVEAEVGPVVLVARVQQPAQLLTKTPESEAQRHSILELSLLNRQQKEREWKRDRKQEISAQISE